MVPSSCDVLVLGQGIAGLLATAAAHAAGLSAVVVERAPQNRGAGVPHASQLHNILGRGRRELERVLPGLTSELAGFDGVRARVSSDTYVFDAGRRAVERDLGRELWSIPRLRLEDAIRMRGETVPDDVIDGRVVGVEVEYGNCVGAWVARTTGERRLIRAGLVVDAMGATSPVREWLRAVGHDVPQVEVEVDQWYASAVVKPVTRSSRFAMVFPYLDQTRGGLASPRADGSYVVSLNGIGAVDSPPTTAESFVAYAESLPDPVLAELLAGGEVGKPTLYRRPRAQWNRFDVAPVDGLVAVGDSSGAPNPLLGQGVSGTAWEARALGDALASSSKAAGYSQTAGRIRAAVWDLMTLHSPLRSDVPDAAAWNRISDYVEDSPEAHTALVDVMHLLTPVGALHNLARGELPQENAEAIWI